MPNIPQNCCYKLINENEIVWKLLKYNTNDAWKMPNLTKEEKIALIYPGTPEYEEDYNVYFDCAYLININKTQSLYTEMYN